MSHEAAEALTRISKIEFLIHPGFNSSEHGTPPRRSMFDMSPEEMSENAPSVSTSTHVPNKWDALLDHYIERAKSLPQDTLMVGFTNIYRFGLHRDDTPYVQALWKIREILGKRFILLGNTQKIMPDGDQTTEGFETIKRIARARGFSIDRHITSEAYGELLDGCVEDAANYLNTTGTLIKKTKILPQLTNNILSPKSPEEMKEYKQAAKRKYPRIKY